MVTIDIYVMVWHTRRKGGNFNLQYRISMTFIQIDQEHLKWRIDKQGTDTRLDILSPQAWPVHETNFRTHWRPKTYKN